MELTKQHRRLLLAAADREDGLLLRPETLGGAALRRMADRLLAGGVAETAPAGKGEPYWFKGAEEGLTGLRIIEAGRILVSGSAERNQEAGDEMRADSADAGGCVRGAARRPGTKRALLLDLLRRDSGATLDTLADVLGWQPHTVRAALTRLRQGGVTIDRMPGQGGTAYRAIDDIPQDVLADPGVDA